MCGQWQMEGRFENLFEIFAVLFIPFSGAEITHFTFNITGGGGYDLSALVRFLVRN